MSVMSTWMGTSFDFPLSQTSYSQRLPPIHHPSLSKVTHLASHIHLLPLGFLILLFMLLPTPIGSGLQLMLTQKGWFLSWARGYYALPPIPLSPFCHHSLLLHVHYCSYTHATTFLLPHVYAMTSKDQSQHSKQQDVWWTTVLIFLTCQRWMFIGCMFNFVVFMVGWAISAPSVLSCWIYIHYNWCAQPFLSWQTSLIFASQI